MRSPLVFAALVLLLASPGAEARPIASAAEVEAPAPELRFADPERTIVSYGTSVAKAPTDTFVIFGGPGTLEGKFQDAGGNPDWQGWTGVDRTFDVPKWQVSTFNAETLGGHGPGNHALWCGRDATQEPGWATPPGYGNNWREVLEFVTEPVADPSQGQVVNLDFYLHYDTEPTFDFVEVWFLRDGLGVQTLSLDGTNGDGMGGFPAPGVRYSDVATTPIEFFGDDYGSGLNDDRILIQIVFRSDGAWSDEDGLFESQAGALQIDDISVVWSDGTSFEDFENGTAADWKPPVLPFGDFSEVWSDLAQFDPCVSNPSPVMSFRDAGQDACPEGLEQWVLGWECSTGGATSDSPAGQAYPWVLPYLVGISDVNGVYGSAPLHNEVQSPVIPWDLPGVEDDGSDVVGATLEFDVYDHHIGDIFFYTRVRVRLEDDTWTDWQSGFLLAFAGSEWRRLELDITPHVEPGMTALQVALGVDDIREHIFVPTYDATAAPYFDNVTVKKWQAPGIRLEAVDRRLAQDAFAPSGGTDVSSAAARDLLDVPFSAAMDIRTSETVNVPGDSVVVVAEPVIPGTALADLRMRWVLEKNPVFEDAIRAAPARPEDQNVNTSDPSRWTGEVVATQATTSSGFVVQDTYYFDLPDEDFLYPGDVLRYGFVAYDTDARMTTLPEDLSTLASGVGHPRRFRVNALPSVGNTNGGQPSTLVVIASGHREEEQAFLDAFAEFAQWPGDDFDLYTSKDASQGSGLGSTGAHGPSVEQLSEYQEIYYSTGSRPVYDIDRQDADDLALLSSWQGEPGFRHTVYFGDRLVSALAERSAATQAYLQDVMGIDYVDDDVSDEIEGQTRPRATPGNVFDDFVAAGGCPDPRAFASIRPRPGASVFYQYLDLAGDPYAPAVPAAIRYDHSPAGSDVVDWTFNASLSSMEPVPEPQGWGGAAEVLHRVYCSTVRFCFTGAEDDLPQRLRASIDVFPSPFNPTTTVKLVAPQRGTLTVEAYDLRGRKVRTLHRGDIAEPGELQVQWDGRDDHGVALASGVYVIRAEGAGMDHRQKVALIK